MNKKNRKAAENKEFRNNNRQHPVEKQRKIGMYAVKHSAEPGSLTHLRWPVQV